MKRPAVVYHDGIRYHMTKGKTPDRTGRTRFSFWSSHPWPFHHAHFTTEDSREAFRHFLDFVKSTREYLKTKS